MKGAPRESHVEPRKCAAEDCETTFKPHAWGAIKARGRGWFIQKDGTAWCPAHVPEWVVGWRAQKTHKQEGIR